MDSGADSTLIPHALAPALGLTTADLIAAPDGSGVGSDFKTWTAPSIQLHGWVIAYYDDGTGNGVEPHLWGPKFDLHPWFGETNDMLLGREDFFAAFDTIVFGPRREFHLDWDDTPAP